jgi:hypothetical protein
LAPAIALLSGVPSASIARIIPGLEIDSLTQAITILALFANLDLSSFVPGLASESIIPEVQVDGC